MADDELSAPLGQKKKNKARRFRLPIRVSHVVAGLLGLFLLACAVWALAVDDPLGGEPLAVVATGFDPPKSPAMPAVVWAGEQGPRSYDGPGTPAAKTCRCRRRTRCRRPGGAGHSRAKRQDRHHHRRLDRQAPGGADPGLARPRAPLE